jgi:hypothetical protein
MAHKIGKYDNEWLTGTVWKEIHVWYFEAL